MAKVSIGTALGAGFRLFRARPGLIPAWGLAWLVLGILPQVLGYLVLWPDLLAAYTPVMRDLAAGLDPDPEGPALVALQQRMLPWQLLQFPLALAGQSIFFAAVCRAVLTPNDRRFAYLRFGRPELQLILVQLAIIGIIILTVVAALILGTFIVLGITLAAGGQGGDVRGLATFGVALVGMILFGWAALRLSLAMPMTVTEGRFRLLESWSLTRGHGWKLFGLAVALVALLLLIEVAVVIVAVILAVVGGVAGSLAGIGAHLQALAAQPPEAWAAQLAPWAVLGLILYGMLAAVLQTLMAAPFIDVYRQLTAGDEAQASPASTWA